MAFDLLPETVRVIAGRPPMKFTPEVVNDKKKAAAYLRRAADLIDEHGHAKWAQNIRVEEHKSPLNWAGEPYDYTQHRIGSMCALGAIRHAADERDDDAWNSMFDAVNAFDRGHKIHLPYSRTDLRQDSLVVFNNHPETTHEEVTSLLRSRADMLEALA